MVVRNWPEGGSKVLRKSSPGWVKDRENRRVCPRGKRILHAEEPLDPGCARLVDLAELAAARDRHGALRDLSRGVRNRSKD